MKRLGFHQFYAHGGDWGWLVTTNMAQLQPKYDTHKVCLQMINAVKPHYTMCMATVFHCISRNRWEPMSTLCFSLTSVFSYLRTIKGLHVNFAPPSKPGLSMALSIMFGRQFPKLFGFTELDVRRLYPCMEKLVVESIKETGYLHIQATKPDTVGKNWRRLSWFISSKL